MKATIPEATMGFTVAELIAMIALIALWILVLVPALANTGASSRTNQCLNNVRQLASAWQMYTDHNGGRLPPSADLGGGTGWVNGHLTWGLENANTNISNLTNGRLGPYIQGDLRVYRCPGDDFLSQVQRSAGWKERVRSISMNWFMEGGLYNDPSGGSRWHPNYYRYDKLSDLVRPAPRDLWLLMDQHPDTIRDGEFIIVVTNAAQLVDVPASYHNGASSIAFADSHAEPHKWKESTTIVPVTFGASQDYPTGGQWRDLIWLQEHSSAPR